MGKHMTYTTIAGGKKIYAKLFRLQAKPATNAIECPICGKREHISMVATTTQYSFVADLHWDVYNCADCYENFCLEYESELKLEAMIARFR